MSHYLENDTPLNAIQVDDLFLGYVVDDEGRHYLPLRPTCRLLNVDFNHQRKELHEHPVLSRELVEMQIPVWGRQTGPKAGSTQPENTEATMPMARDAGSALVMQRRRSLCLPDSFYLGWVTTLPARDMAVLVQWRIFFKLWDHMRDSGAQLRPFVAKRNKLEARRHELLQKLAEDRTYQELLEVDRSLSQTKSEITKANKARLKQVEMEFPALASGT